MSTMADLEKVVRAMDCLSRNSQDGTCDGCAYFRPFSDDPDTGWCDRKVAMADALTLLQRQEPVKPKVEPAIVSAFKVYRCGHCDTIFLQRRQKYCADCGKKVKWE